MCILTWMYVYRLCLTASPQREHGTTLDREWQAIQFASQVTCLGSVVTLDTQTV